MIRNITKNKILAKNCIIKNSLFSKFIGLMFKKKQASAVFNFYIENNHYIHTLFMNYSIDILFLDKNKIVAKIIRSARPWRLSISGNGKYIVELPAGKAMNTEKGDKISFK